ncbi:MAG: TolC family protein [Candidatus Thiodiazotropha sp. (ex Monitilora ramsayi)]|nr:TolC family protein [Candidatus Thiodiazotropha sp. (ex Monitilora ramsayi)]
MRFHMGIITLLWAACLTAAPQTEIKQSLNLAQAIAAVLENNPQLQTANFDTQAAAARIRQQMQSPPMKLAVDVENLGGTGNNSGIRQLETTFSLTRMLELGDKPMLRGGIARSEAALLSNEQDAIRLDLLSETAKRFLDVANTQEQRNLARERISLRQKTLKVVQQRFRLGKAAAAELNGARINLVRAELALEGTDHQLASTRRALAVLWGELTPGFQTVTGNVFALAPTPDIATLDQLLEQNPSLVRFATQRRLAETRLRLAESARLPDIEFSGGLKHFNASDDVGLLFSVSIPLGSDKRALPRVNEASALAEKEPLLAKDKRLALRSTLFGLHQELVHASHIVETLKTRVLPEAKAALEDYTLGYTAGRYSLLELVQAQDTLLQARLEVLNAAADYQRNRLEIDRLTGGAMSPISAPGGAQ